MRKGIKLYLSRHYFRVAGEKTMEGVHFFLCSGYLNFSDVGNRLTHKCGMRWQFLEAAIVNMFYVAIFFAT